ncbi:Rpn family recombination-promoting nuclease/putative transposase, partial [Anaerovibrio sp.]|uniref:Rpn family recombination-promoting nuclease/putative transposase n=1 Tax=Anaerovibrio sp. TaxID=1872532 RepID=UPI003F1456AC
RLLSLANALKGTSYKSPEIIRLNTLDGSFFSSIKNDISMHFNDTCLILIEHQSTINRNMPLRLLNYVNELYRRFIHPLYRKIYERTLIRLPAPEFHVFYDGEQKDFDYERLRLSDAFIQPGNDLELVVHCHNLNIGMSRNLKRQCRPLWEYSIFSGQFKKYRRQKMSIPAATQKAIDFCRRHNIMSDYLKRNESEVIDMFGFEWNEKEEREALLEAGEARGKIASLRELLAKGLISMDALKSSGLYSTEELTAISKP